MIFGIKKFEIVGTAILFAGIMLAVSISVQKEKNMSTIETRELSNEGIEIIESNTAFDLEDNYRDDDYLYMLGIAFKMVHYSADDINGQSCAVTWWSELYDIEIQVNRVDNTVTVETPVIDYRKDGF